MHNPSFLLRMVTIASSILLVIGFVSYRVGAFDGVANARAPGTSWEPSAVPVSAGPAGSQKPPAPGAKRRPVLLDGTKSAILIIPQLPSDSNSSTTAQ